MVKIIITYKINFVNCFGLFSKIQKLGDGRYGHRPWRCVIRIIDPAFLRLFCRSISGSGCRFPSWCRLAHGLHCRILYYLYGVLIAAAVDFFLRTRCLIPDFREKAHTYYTKISMTARFDIQYPIVDKRMVT